MLVNHAITSLTKGFEQYQEMKRFLVLYLTLKSVSLDDMTLNNEKLGFLPKHFSLFSYLSFNTIFQLYIIVYNSVTLISKQMHQIVYVSKIFCKIWFTVFFYHIFSCQIKNIDITFMYSLFQNSNFSSLLLFHLSHF